MGQEDFVSQEKINQQGKWRINALNIGIGEKLHSQQNKNGNNKNCWLSYYIVVSGSN